MLNLAKHLRKINGVTIKAAAEYCGCSAKTYRKHEFNFNNMPLYYFLKMAEGCGYEMEVFGYGMQKMGTVDFELKRQNKEGDFLFTETIRSGRFSKTDTGKASS